MESPERTRRRSKFTSERYVPGRKRTRSPSSSRSRSPSRRPRITNRKTGSPSRRNASSSRTRKTRSRSRTPPKKNEELLSVSQVKELMNEQQNSLLEILGHHREDVDELISSKTKKFRKPAIEKQHLFNSSMLQLLQRIKKEHKKQHFESAYTIIKEAISKLENQQSDLLIADQSKYGFLTVNLLHGNTELPSSVAKKVEKIAKKTLFPLNLLGS